MENRITLGMLNEEIPLINWNIYFDKRFEFYGFDNPFDINSNITENINVFYNYFIKKVDVNDLINYAEW